MSTDVALSTTVTDRSCKTYGDLIKNNTVLYPKELSKCATRQKAVDIDPWRSISINYQQLQHCPENMDSNDMNRRVRYALMLDDADVLQLLNLAKFDADLASIAGWRLKEGEPGHVACGPKALHAMLDGLIVQRRGPREDSAVAAPTGLQEASERPTATELRQVDNNEVLKQLRIALSLKSDDVFGIIEKGGGTVGKSEVKALFQKPSARNYRRCGDQVLRWFLAGLAAQRKA